jgi:hypothetical protein
MDATDIERRLAPFHAIDAYVSVRTENDGSVNVWGLQCCNRAANDDHLALLTQFPNLLALGFEGTQITDAGLVHLLSLTRVETLDLTRTGISDEGIVHLAQMSWLQYLHIEETRISNTGGLELQTRLPDCEIVSDWS